MAHFPAHEIVAVRKTELALSKIEREIEETLDPRRACSLGAEAEAVKALAKKARRGVEVINRAVEIKIRALRRMAELLDELKKNGIGRHGGDRRSSSRGESLRISDLGIDHNEVHRARQLAKVPQAIFDRCLQVAQDANQEMSTAAFLRLARRYDKQKARRPGVHQKLGKGKRDLGAGAVLPCQPGQLFGYLDEIGEHRDLLQMLLGPICKKNDIDLRREERQHVMRLLVEIERLLDQARGAAEGLSVTPEVPITTRPRS